MSPVRKRDPRRLAARSHLVLVRGGLDRAEPADPEWQSFCERIGWKPVETELPDDYEDRLAERIFGEGAHLDGAERLDAPSMPRAALADAERHRSAMDDGQPIALAPAAERRARRTLAAANVAVIAVLCAAASAMLWWAARPPVSALPRPDAVAPLRATVAPVVDGDAPPEPSERLRDPAPRERAPRNEEVPTRPAPSKTKPATPDIVGPGSPIAQRPRRDENGARRPEESLARSAQPAQAASRAAAASIEPTAAAALRPEPYEAVASVQPSSPGIRIDVAPPEDIGLARAVPPVSRVWPEPAASDAWTRSAASDRATPASATWSLSPDNPRWFGVGLPPSGASAGLLPAVGVMAQLDVGKAIDRL